MLALQAAIEHDFDDFLDPRELSIGQGILLPFENVGKGPFSVLYIDNQKIEDDMVVISALTDCAVQIESSRIDFDGAWLPFFSINFLKNRQKLSARAEVNFRGTFSALFVI